MSSKTTKTVTDTPRYAAATASSSRSTLTSVIARAPTPTNITSKNNSSSNKNIKISNNNSDSEKHDYISTYTDSTESNDNNTEKDTNNNTHTRSLTHTNLSNNTSISPLSSPTLSSVDYSNPGFNNDNNISSEKVDNILKVENDTLKRELTEMRTMMIKMLKDSEQSKSETQQLIKTISYLRTQQISENQKSNETLSNINNYHIDDEFDNNNDSINNNHKKSSDKSNKHVKVKNEPQKHIYTSDHDENVNTDLTEENTDDQKYTDTGEDNDNVDSDQYEVKEILAERVKNGIRQYKVWWKNYSKSESTWHSFDELDCPDKLSEWNLKKRRRELKREKEEKEFIPEFKVPISNLRFKSESNLKHQTYTSKNSANSKITVKSQNIKSDQKFRDRKHDPPDDSDHTDSDNNDGSGSEDEASVSRERDNPFEYLIPMLKLRERIYPISDPRYQSLYIGRYSLLDMDWRMSEVYRFGLLVNFDPALYPSTYRKLYDLMRINRELEPKWYPKVRKNSVTETHLPQLVMTYSDEDMNLKGNSHRQDFNLTEKSTTLNALPAVLRKHPPNWSYIKTMHSIPTFTELVSKRLDEEVYDNSVKLRDGLRRLTADRAIKLHGEQIPKLEFDQFNINKNSENIYLDANSSYNVDSVNSSNNLNLTDVKHNFIKNELKRDNIAGQLAAEQNIIFKHILGEVSMDIRAAIILELNKRQYGGSENRFADKTLLKKPPAPKELFTGKDMTLAASTLYYILVGIAKYDFTVPESISFIEAVFSEDALIWFHNLQSDIQSQRYENQLYRFVQLFKEQYLNAAMAVMYEKRVRMCRLQHESPNAVDFHFNQFTKLASCWRACDYTVLDSKLIHMYFTNLPIETQRTLGASALKTCKNISDLYVQVKESVTMISKYQPRIYDKDIVSINSIHTNDYDEYGDSNYKPNYRNNYNRNNHRNNYHRSKHNNNFKNNYTNFNSYSHYEEQSESDEDIISDDDNTHNDDRYDYEPFDDTQYNYIYPTDTELYNENTYNNDIDTVYFNATHMVSKDYYSRDWKCFHCGEIGHRAGWFCPLVRLNKDQTPRGAAAYAEYLKKYAKEIKPYDINHIKSIEKTYWESKGKDIKQIVQEKLRSVPNVVNDNYKNNNKYSNNKNNSKYNNKQKGSNSSSVIHGSENLRAKIAAHRDQLKNKANRDVTTVNDDDTDVDNEVQVVQQNSLHTYINDDIEYVEVPSYTIHLNSITNLENSENEELAIIHKLTRTEKKYAHPLLVQVDLNDIQQNVLLDQGATRNICRKTVLDKYYPNIFHEILPGKCAVISSSGTMIPIKSRVKLSVRVSEDEYQDAVFYVVSNTPTRDIIASFVLGRTFLSMSGLCYDNKTDILFNKHNTDKIYMKVLNGKISSTEQGECPTDIIPLCTTITCDNISNDTITCNNDKNNIINHNNMITSDIKKVTVINKKVHLNVQMHSSNVINNNNKKKDITHKNKIQQRYNNNKQRVIDKQLKHEQILKAVKNHLDSDTKNKHSEAMKNIILNHFEINIDKYDLVDAKSATTSILSMFNHNDITDKNIIKEEKQARVKSYMQAYEQSKNENESDIIMDQLLQILNEKDTDSDDDAIMKNINDITELSAPSKQEDTPDIIQKKIDKVHEIINSMKHLNKDQKQQLIKEICDHIDVYSLAGENFKQTDIVEHDINLEENTKPFHQRLRVYSPALQQIIDTEVHKMIQDNIIIKSNSPFASNLLLVRKPDPSSPGGIKNRVCVNFIQLNKLTIKDRYPLPNQQDIFRQIGSAKYFTTMDLMSGFWQIAIKPEHRHKTAFITTRGLYEFLVMPFGLCNAPSTFQRMMDKIIKPEYRSFIQTYIVDIILYSKTFGQHVEHISIFHKILRENKLTVKLLKCH